MPINWVKYIATCTTLTFHVKREESLRQQSIGIIIYACKICFSKAPVSRRFETYTISSFFSARSLVVPLLFRGGGRGGCLFGVALQFRYVTVERRRIYFRRTPRNRRSNGARANPSQTMMSLGLTIATTRPVYARIYVYIYVYCARAHSRSGVVEVIMNIGMMMSRSTDDMP